MVVTFCSCPYQGADSSPGLASCLNRGIWGRSLLEKLSSEDATMGEVILRCWRRQSGAERGYFRSCRQDRWWAHLKWLKRVSLARCTYRFWKLSHGFVTTTIVVVSKHLTFHTTLGTGCSNYLGLWAKLSTPYPMPQLACSLRNLSRINYYDFDFWFLK